MYLSLKRDAFLFMKASNLRSSDTCTPGTIITLNWEQKPSLSSSPPAQRAGGGGEGVWGKRTTHERLRMGIRQSTLVLADTLECKTNCEK